MIKIRFVGTSLPVFCSMALVIASSLPCLTNGQVMSLAPCLTPGCIFCFLALLSKEVVAASWARENQAPLRESLEPVAE